MSHMKTSEKKMKKERKHSIKQLIRPLLFPTHEKTAIEKKNMIHTNSENVLFNLFNIFQAISEYKHLSEVLSESKLLGWHKTYLKIWTVLVYVIWWVGVA